MQRYLSNLLKQVPLIITAIILKNINDDFVFQLNEFKEGNLLFEVMQRKIWDAATADTAALKKFYQKNKNKYWWENSADAIIFTCADATCRKPES